MTNGKRNRNAGHSWEREGVKAFSFLYPEVKTSRSVSRARDAEKVDLAYSDEIKLGRFPYNAQYKSYSIPLRYPLILSEMPQGGKEINVVMHRQTEKSGSRFMTKGKFSIMSVDDFFRLAQWRVGYEILRDFFDNLACDSQPSAECANVTQNLKRIGL